MATDKPKVFFVRVTEEMYGEITALAEKEERTGANMTRVLLGYALNRYPDGIVSPKFLFNTAPQEPKQAPFEEAA